MKELDRLFDIANQNAMQKMIIEEDKQFLLAQRAGRQGCMLSVDQKLTKTEKKLLSKEPKKRKEKEERRKETSTKATLTSKKLD